MTIETCLKTKASVLIALLAVSGARRFQQQSHLIAGRGLHAGVASAADADGGSDEELESTMAQPNRQSLIEFFNGELGVMMCGTNVRGQANRAALQVEAMIDDPTFQARMKQVAAQVEAMLADPQSQEQANRVSEQMEGIMAETASLEQRERAADQVKEIMAESKWQAHAERVAETMKGLISDPSFVKPARFIAQCSKAVIADLMSREHDEGKSLEEPSETMPTNQSLPKQVKLMQAQVQAMDAEPSALVESSRLVGQAIFDPLHISSAWRAGRLRVAIKRPKFSTSSQPGMPRRADNVRLRKPRSRLAPLRMIHGEADHTNQDMSLNNSEGMMGIPNASGSMISPGSDIPAHSHVEDTVQERLRLFWKLAVPYFQEAEGAKLNFGFLLALVLAQSATSVIFSYVGRDFYSALSAKDQALFLEKTANFALGLVVATPLSTLFRFQRGRLAVSWREWMTTELVRQYSSDQAFYKVEFEKDLDNPDQRITDDVNAFTAVSLEFFITLTKSVINFVSFSGILYSIYPDLFYAIFAYAAIGSLTTVKLGQTLVGQNAEQLRREADLRYLLVRLRENAESIAFYLGEKQEEVAVNARLSSAVENQRSILRTQRNLEFFTTAYNYLVQILPVLVVSPLYFAGTVELGVVTQSTGAFNNVLRDLSLIVNQFEGISAFSAGISRLSTFVERMESYLDNQTANMSTFQLSTPRNKTQTQRIRSEEITGPSVLHIDGLSLYTPDGSRKLFDNISVDVLPGEHLLIMGNSGTGKSSLLRAAGGLWDRGSGVIARPPPEETMFLPQRPYCTLGSLREQLVYPRPVASATASDAELLAALRKVQLGRLAVKGESGLDEVRDWGDELSLGEQQRLAFARVLIYKPKAVFLDEATSALDIQNEAIMYDAMAALPGLTYVSVGHRPSLLRYHALRLRMYGAERTPSFTVEPIRDGAVMAQQEMGA